MSAKSTNYLLPPWLDRSLQEPYREVMRITSHLFGGSVEARQDYDPECLQEKYVVFSVTVDNADLALKLEQEWVREVRPISRQWPAFSLSLDLCQ